MIYQPRNVQPSATSIDATQDNTFTMEAQTNTYINAYQLTIVDFDNNIIYSGDKTSLSTVAYNGDIISISVPSSINLDNGTNYKWRAKLYQETSDMLITYGLVQQESTTTNIYLQSNINIREGMSIKINEQTHVISTYNVSTGLATVSTAFSSTPQVGDKYYIYSDFIETVPDYVFYARAYPTVSINNVPQSLTLKYHTFQGVYNQPDGVPIVYHTFDLYMQNNDGSSTLVDSSGKVYSANLTYTYDGFRTGNTYAIKMTIENDMGIVSETELYTFNVSYDIVEYLQQPQAVFNSDSNANRITWITPVEHDAEIINVEGSTGDVSSAQYLYNTPYNGVNSLYLNSYEAQWYSEDGLCVMPTKNNITMQFSPDENFFFNEDGTYNNMMPIIETETDDTFNIGAFTIFINDKYLVMTTPHVVDGALDSNSVATPPEGASNTTSAIYLTKDINIEETPYITFVSHDWIEEVVSYDPSSKLATFKKPLPFTPEVGDNLYTNDFVSSPFYTGTQEVFVLSSTNVVQPNNDYVWQDSATWNDTYYWVEGGTALSRVCNHWWKAHITDENIKIEELN